MPRFLRRTVEGLLLISALLACLIYSVTWRPNAKEVLTLTCPITAPVLVPGQALKIMTWNIQSFREFASGQETGLGRVRVRFPGAQIDGLR